MCTELVIQMYMYIRQYIKAHSELPVHVALYFLRIFFKTLSFQLERTHLNAPPLASVKFARVIFPVVLPYTASSYIDPKSNVARCNQCIYIAVKLWDRHFNSVGSHFLSGCR